MATTTLTPPKQYENIDLVEQNALDHVWIHYAPWVDVAAKDGLRVMVKGEGSKLWDIHGREYIDGISGLWVVNAGHGRADIADAMGTQAKELAYVSSMSFTTGTSRAARRYARRPDPWRPQPRLLRLRWIRSGRNRAQDRQAGSGHARLPTSIQDHRPSRFATTV